MAGRTYPLPAAGRVGEGSFRGATAQPTPSPLRGGLGRGPSTARVRGLLPPRRGEGWGGVLPVRECARSTPSPPRGGLGRGPSGVRVHGLPPPRCGEGWGGVLLLRECTLYPLPAAGRVGLGSFCCATARSTPSPLRGGLGRGPSAVRECAVHSLPAAGRVGEGSFRCGSARGLLPPRRGEGWGGVLPGCECTVYSLPAAGRVGEGSFCCGSARSTPSPPLGGLGWGPSAARLRGLLPPRCGEGWGRGPSAVRECAVHSLPAAGRVGEGSFCCASVQPTPSPPRGGLGRGPSTARVHGLPPPRCGEGWVGVLPLRDCAVYSLPAAGRVGEGSFRGASALKGYSLPAAGRVGEGSFRRA